MRRKTNNMLLLLGLGLISLALLLPAVAEAKKKRKKKRSRSARYAKVVAPEIEVKRRDISLGEDLGLEPQNITVGTLSREDVAKIIFELVGDNIGARLLAQRIHKETEGNAYFVTEFLRSLLGKGVIKRKDGSWLLLGPNGALS